MAAKWQESADCTDKLLKILICLPSFNLQKCNPGYSWEQLRLCAIQAKRVKPVQGLTKFCLQPLLHPSPVSKSITKFDDN